MVAGDGDDVRFLFQQDRQRGIEIFNRFFLRGEIAVFTVFVGVFVMDEKKS